MFRADIENDISGNVAVGSVYSGLQSMAAGGAGGVAAAKAVGGFLELELTWLPGRERRMANLSQKQSFQTKS